MKAAATVRSLTGFAIGSTLVLALALERFAVPVGATAISAAIPILILAPLAWALIGVLKPNPSALILYAVTVGVCGIVQMFGGQLVSLPSFLLLVAIHSAYIWRAHEDTMRPLAHLHLFRHIGLGFALAAFAQLGLQWLLRDTALAFPLETWAPDRILPNYTNQIPIEGTLFKPNGFLLDEPSILSQVLAAALVVELVLKGIGVRALVIGLALVATFSGTGLVMLAAALPALIGRHRRLGTLLLPIILVPIVLIAAGEVATNLLAARVGEFWNPQSSAYARFIGIFDLLGEHVFGDPRTMLLGKGAGSITAAIEHGETLSHDPTWGKMIFEYGLTGGLVYIITMLALMLSSGAPLALRVALATQFFFTGGYALTAPAHVLILPLLIWPAASAQRALGPRDRVSPRAMEALRRNARLARGRVTIASIAPVTKSGTARP